jgi:hypothetical protein
MNQEETEKNTQQDVYALDVLLIGGGIQGLVLLETLTGRGYATGLVTNTPLGHGQSLHAHGLLESGYTKPQPELRASVVKDWLPYLKGHRVDVYGNWYVLTPDDLFQKLRSAWDEGGYPYGMGSLDDLPDVYRKGDLFTRGGETRVVATKDYCFPKRQLIRALASGHEERIVIGDIKGFTFASTGKAIGIETVEVRVHATSEKVRLLPGYAVVTAGAGTPRLINSIADGVATAGGDGAKVRAALDPVTFDNLHMLTLRGHPDYLPNLSAFVPSKRLKIVSHLNDGHDRVGGKGDLVTWYVTNEPLSPISPADATDTAEGTVDPEHMAEGFKKLFSMVPPIRERAKEGKIEFFVYAGCKQGIGGEVNVQYCKAIDGLANVALALPSLAGGVWITAKQAANLVRAAIEPKGQVAKVPGAGHVVVGDVIEHGDDVEWLDWDRLVATYPGIES